MKASTKSESLIMSLIAGGGAGLTATVAASMINHDWLFWSKMTLSGVPNATGTAVISVITGISLAVFGGVSYALHAARKDETHQDGSEIGDASDLERMEAEGVKASGAGVKIGGVTLSRRRESGHLRLIGLPGSGKTVLLNSILMQVINNRLLDKVVIHDPKGDFVQWVKDPIIYAPWDKRSARWLIGVDIDSQALAIEAAKAWIPQNNGENAQFAEGAAQILAGLIFNLQKTRGTAWGFADLSRIIGSSQKSICEFAVAGWPAVSGLVASDEKGNLTRTTMSYLSTMLAPLSWVHQVASAESVATTSISFRAFAITEPPINRVLIFKNDARFAKAAETLFALTLRIIAQNLCSPVVAERKGDGAATWFFLDEFPQLAKSAGESVKMIQEVGRSKGARVILAAQDLAQFTERYGKEEGEVMTRLQQTVIYGRVSNDSAHEISSRAAKKTVLRTGRSLNENGNNSESLNQVEVPVIEPDDLTGLAIRKTGVEFIIQIEAQPAKVFVEFVDTPAVRESAIDNAAFMRVTPADVVELSSELEEKEVKSLMSAPVSPTSLSLASPSITAAMAGEELDAMNFDDFDPSDAKE
jgi:type IV secretory pathway TraG/TraD family ATPase VirD4